METRSLPSTGLQFSLGEIDAELARSFDDLPHDDHLNSGFPFRLRRYSRCRFSAGNVEWLIPTPFVQAVEHNPLAGGRPRSFHPLHSDTEQRIASAIIPTLANRLPGDNFTIGVHQIRVVATDTEMGEPSPEGIHRDGFDFVAVVAVARTNVTGGVTSLFDPADHNKALFEETLDCGDVLLFDDRNVAHYTTPISPRDSGTASRDVFVVTFTIDNGD